MSKTLELLKGLPLGDLRRLIAFKENEDDINSLYEEREKHLQAADQIQKQIDELITQGTGIVQKKRHGPSVKMMCAEILKRKRNGLTPAQINKAIVDKYPHKQSKTLYNQVYIALTRNTDFKRISENKFILRK